MGTWCAGLVAGLSLVAGARAGDLNHEVLALEFEAAMGLDCGDGCTVEGLLSAHYARLELGSFELLYPAPYLAEKREAERLAECAEAVLELDLAWMDWTGAEGEAAKAARKDAKAIATWIGGWKPAQLAPAALGQTLDVVQLVGGKQKELAALERWNAAALSGAALGLALEDRARVRVVFAPDRRSLVGAASFVGLVDERNRASWWTDDLIFWTDFWWNDVQWVALAYPPTHPTAADWHRGSDMDERERTGMLQHVAQRAAYGLAWRMFGRDLDPAFESGLAQNLVIAVYGENNTRSGGSTRGKATRAYSVFIPGGNSEGGLLPKNNADSKWRDDLGADYFVNALRNSQKVAGKSVPNGDKVAYFELQADRGGDTFAVAAPFFGTPAQGKQLPPEAFLSDYREFFRAYKSCFAHWLATAGTGKKRDSPGRFAELLRRMCDDQGGDDLEAMVLDLYGVPLSAADGQGDSLEWRFLTWLSRQ